VEKGHRKRVGQGGTEVKAHPHLRPHDMEIKENVLGKLNEEIHPDEKSHSFEKAESVKI